MLPKHIVVVTAVAAPAVIVELIYAQTILTLQENINLACKTSTMTTFLFKPTDDGEVQMNWHKMVASEDSNRLAKDCQL